MNIKIHESADGGWNLWVTATEAPDAKPVYAAWGRTPAQIEVLLRGILAEATPLPEPAPAVKDGPYEAVRRGGLRLALRGVLNALEMWIEGAQSNHRAMEHRGENTGEECWRQIEPADIRLMVNDVARELGVAEFPTPEVAREDTP